MATLEVAFLHSQLEDRKRRWEAAIALTPQKANLAGLLREVHLVHLLDEEKRRELMINYGEDLLPTGFTAGELSEGGKAHDRWPGIADALFERAESRVTVEPAQVKGQPK
ncbi:MAG TPA: hypothetical protein VEV41_08940 [Terriglobales bacterium]|nr:hypothetical protein [Terriglobales bacterium]